MMLLGHPKKQNRMLQEKKNYKADLTRVMHMLQDPHTSARVSQSKGSIALMSR